MIYNINKKIIVSHRPESAFTFMARGRGMIGRDFTDFDALVFQNCGCIHTLFMNINIDVLFLDRENIIRGTQERLRPWRPLVSCGGASTVIELPEGTVSRTNCETGDTLDLNAELSEAEAMKLAMGRKLVIPTAEAAIPMKGGHE